jgi:hypothetical protein
MSGCSFLKSTASYFYENIEITWKPDKAKDTEPVDSIVVHFPPVYWTEPPCEFVTEEKETEFTKSGYEVWILDNPFARRVEVKRQDTVIYIYRK